MSDQDAGAGQQGWTPPPSGGMPPPPGGAPPPPPGTPPGGWQQPPPQAWQPTAPPPSSGGSGCLKVGLIILAVLAFFGILGVACIAVVGNKVVDEIEKNTGTAKASDYELDEGDCTVSELGSIEATGQITNTSGKDQGFEIEYRFIDPDGTQLSVDSAFTDNIAKGGTAAYSVFGVTSDVPQGSKCELRGVNYSILDNESGN